MKQRLAWANGPEATSSRAGCTSYATGEDSTFELHRAPQRVDGKRVIRYRLHVDGQPVGELGTMTDCRHLAELVLAGHV